MHPIDFEGSNIIMGKPDDMTDDQCMAVPAFKGVDSDGFKFTLTYWMPNKEDLDALNAGRGVAVKVLGERMPPVALYTIDENQNANV